MRKNLVKIGHIFRAICSRTDRHTRSSQYSAAHTGVTSGQMSGHWVSYGQTRGSDESLVERASLSYTRRADAGHRTDPCNPFTVINHRCSGRNCTRPAWKTLTSERQFLYSFLRHFPVRVRPVVKVRGAQPPPASTWAPLLESEPSLPTAGPKLLNSTKNHNVRCRINKF